MMPWTGDVSKPNPEDWSKYLEYYPDFKKDFYSIINDSNMPEVDADFAPDVFDDTYFNIELTISRDGDRTDFSKVKKMFDVQAGDANRSSPQ